MPPAWTILIATLGSRAGQLARLLDTLLPQVQAAAGEVTVEALWNNGEQSIGHVRQALLDHATARYVSFVDDDDLVAGSFVADILPLLDGVDYVGFNVEIMSGPHAGGVACHSLQHDSWREDEGLRYYRHVSHLNPVRRELALTAAYQATSVAEDYAWAQAVRPQVRTEYYLDRVMYLYYPAPGPRADDSGPVKFILPPAEYLPEVSTDSVLKYVIPHPPGTAGRLPGTVTWQRLAVASPHFSWHPASSPEE